MELIAHYNCKQKGKIVLDGEMNAHPSDDTLRDNDGSGSEVSENASMDHDDVDDMLDVHDVNPGDTNNSENNANNVSVDSILASEYEEIEVKNQLPLVDEKLSSIVTKWLHSGLPRDCIKELFKQCLLPENIPGLTLVKINELLYVKLSLDSKINDQKLCGINSFFARGLGPLISAWDKILKWESALLNLDKGSVPGKVETKGSVASICEISIDFTEIPWEMDKGLKLLSTSHGIILQKRRDQL